MTPLRARLVLAAALLLGVAGDLLFRTAILGLNLVGWVGLALLAALATGWERPFAFDRSVRTRDLLIALAATFLAAAGTLFRAAGTLWFYDVVAMLTAAAVAVWVGRGRSLTRFRVRDLLRAWTSSASTVAIGAPVLALRDAEWERAAPAYDRRIRAAFIGTFLAVPPVLVVGGLLAEADPVFGDFLTSWQRLGLENLIGHVALAAVIAWPAAGWLRGVVAVPAPAEGSYAPPSRIDFFGVAPALYAIVGLVTAYLGLQARALFGGAAYVEATSGLTYAEYARRGFFELVTVTAIVLGLLLVADWALDRSSREASERFRKVGWLLLVLLGILMASALQRMWLYVSYFGLSDTRLYATAGMVWLAAALGWFGWTILRGWRSRFGIGMLVMSAGWLAGLNVIDPERVVVRVNLARALAGQPFDVEYHTSLSADAVPSLLMAAARLPNDQCEAILARLGARGDLLRGGAADWRGWNLPRSRAARLLAPTPALPSGPTCDASSTLQP